MVGVQQELIAAGFGEDLDNSNMPGLARREKGRGAGGRRAEEQGRSSCFQEELHDLEVAGEAGSVQAGLGLSWVLRQRNRPLQQKLVRARL